MGSRSLAGNPKVERQQQSMVKQVATVTDLQLDSRSSLPAHALMCQGYL